MTYAQLSLTIMGIIAYVSVWLSVGVLHCMAINNEFLNSQGQASKVTFM